MLYEFVVLNREAIIARTRDRVRERPWPSVSDSELEHGVPLFLTQLTETLRLEGTHTPFSSDAIGSTAARHGAELLLSGFSVAQVVHDYGDICQAITEIAVEREAPISVQEFHTLNRCLDTAIAEAVTEHTRLTAQRSSADEVERAGQTAHELRDLLNTALLAFHTLKRGTVAINGNTGGVLGRSLTNMGEIIGRSLFEVRLAAGTQRRERIPVISLFDEMAASGILHAEYHRVRFTVEPVLMDVVLEGDRQLLTSAVMNLLQNAFKNTPAGGTVVLRGFPRDGRALIEVEDECGGFPESSVDPFQPFGDRRSRDRSGLGLGLSIARTAVRSHGGDIIIRNLPGKGCVFVCDLPLANEEVSAVSH
jgi:signal transduction histidine kinase